MTSQYKNPPLIEAIFEIKWELTRNTPDSVIDPGYKLASGRLYDRVKKKFGYIQTLPVNSIPEELTPYTVRNQFRVEANGWPLVQFGPGVATVNFTTPYSWKSFRDTIKNFLPQLIDSYTDLPIDKADFPIKIISVSLRYVNAVEWNWSDNDTFPYLADNFHTSFSLPEKITASELISGMPMNINLQTGYQIKDPKGQGIIRFGTGGVGQENGLIWELIFVSQMADAPQISNLENFMEWLNKSHDIIESWFIAITEGKLVKQFKGDEKKVV